MRTLLLIGFAVHVVLGSTCVSQLAYANEDGERVPQHVIGPMSGNRDTSCPFLPDATPARIETEGERSDCSDGHCYKIVPPDPVSGGKTDAVIHEGTGAVPTLADIGDVDDLSESCDPLLFDIPPLPPGVRTVVLRR